MCAPRASARTVASATVSGPPPSGQREASRHPRAHETGPDDEDTCSGADRRVAQTLGERVQSRLRGTVDGVTRARAPAATDDSTISVPPPCAPSRRRQCSINEPAPRKVTRMTSTLSRGSASSACLSTQSGRRRSRRRRTPPAVAKAEATASSWDSQSSASPRRGRQMSRRRCCASSRSAASKRSDPGREARPRQGPSAARRRTMARPMSETATDQQDPTYVPAGTGATMASADGRDGAHRRPSTSPVRTPRSEDHTPSGSMRSRIARHSPARGIHRSEHIRCAPVHPWLDRRARRPRPPTRRRCRASPPRPGRRPACRARASSPPAGTTTARPRPGRSP